MNNKIERTVIRFVGVFLWLMGVGLFSILLFSTLIDFFKGNIQPVSNKAEVVFVVQCFFLSGIVPLFVSIYCLILYKNTKQFYIGAFLVTPIFIALHYLFTVIGAHAIDVIFWCVYLLEVIGGIYAVKKLNKM